MFQFSRCPSYTYVFNARCYRINSNGLPHSEIPGSKSICDSPKLIAACHVLRRLMVPRHSPCALFCLTFFYGRQFSFEFRESSITSNRLLVIIVTLFLINILFCCSQFLFLRYALFSFQSTVRSSHSVVGSSGLEPPTSRLSGARSNRLSYEPI